MPIHEVAVRATGMKSVAASRIASSAAAEAASAARSLRKEPSGEGGSSVSGPSASFSRAISAPMVAHWFRLRRS